MRYFLMKTDPSTYSAADLERERRTVWDGVTNAQAVRFIREMKKGDRALLYHSGASRLSSRWRKSFRRRARIPAIRSRGWWMWSFCAASSRR